MPNTENNLDMSYLSDENLELDSQSSSNCSPTRDSSRKLDKKRPLTYAQKKNPTLLKKTNDFVEMTDESSENGLQKLKRPCKFCKKSFVRLTRHILNKHHDLSEIKYIKLMTPRKRKVEIGKIRNEGIYHFNKEMILNKSSKFQCRRRHISNQNKLLPYCSTCKQFISRKHFRAHKCSSGETKGKQAVITNLQDAFAENFEKDVLGKLLDDDVGQYIRNCPLIQKLGIEEYKSKLDEENSVKSATRCRTFLRCLTSLIITATEKAKSNDIIVNDIADLFVRDKLTYIEFAVESAMKGDISIQTKKNFGYCIKRAAVQLNNTNPVIR